ncbi:MAG: hypothetical protein JSS30_05145 [Verrucomicrobia bacterium]|nr:hypothetical protein [Verrucomicrobiota bacterium]
MSQEDKIISEFLVSIGPWRQFVVIVGGFAPFIYKLYFADPKIQSTPIGTRDIDSLIPRKLPEISQKNISAHLLEAGFVNIFKNVDQPPIESYVKEINGVEVEIEFLTDTATRAEKNKNVLIAGVVAQPLSYLSLSLQRTMQFETYSNEVGKVVSPGAWIFHKGLTFTRRKNPSKLLKDLYGIWYVSSQLREFSEQSVEEFRLLTKQNFKWYETFQKNLGSWIENSSPADWLKLEMQDPSGKLKRFGFEHLRDCPQTQFQPIFGFF